MAKLNDLERYLNYEFSSGCYTGNDYKMFERTYINYLRSLSKENGWEFVKANKNHYCFTAFVKKNNRYVYISVSDVRFNQNAWYYKVLIRRAEHEKDYTGGRNIYVPLPALAIEIKKIVKFCKILSKTCKNK